MERQEIVYRLGTADSDTGVDVREMADVMIAFAETVGETLKVNGDDGELNVNVRPFKEGSFIAEFVLTYAQNIPNFLSSPEGSALANALTILGFCGFSLATVPKVIEKVHGRVEKFSKNDDNTFTYGTGDDTITVDEKTHRVIQSPEVASSYKTVAIGPLLNIGGTMSITIQSGDEFRREDREAGSTFNLGDEYDFETYAEVAGSDSIPEEVEPETHVEHNIPLIPISGPYEGREKGYTFMMTEKKIAGVHIKDDEFLAKIDEGVVRLNNRDVLIVDLEIETESTPGGNPRNHYSILKVDKYVKYEPPKQNALFDGE